MARLYRDVVSPERQDTLFRELLAQVEWQSHRITIFGREMLEPRLSAWVGDEAYRYSGRVRTPLPWTPALDELRSVREEISGARFNSVLCNLYRDGRDSMGWHSDDEPELGEQPVIASISLGSERRFRLRHRTKDEQITTELPPGSLLVMAGACQLHWKHAVPKTARPVEPRINLTFRQILSSA